MLSMCRLKQNAFVFLILLDSSAQGACNQWSPGVKVMDISASQLPEASGLIVSQQISNTFYHVNDAGNGPEIYASNSQSGETVKIKVSYESKDVEDLGYGACGDKQCILIGDIGDNKEKRKSISIVVLEEPEKIPTQFTVKRLVEANYPDGPHNAEGLAVHPNGDVFIVTKEKNKKSEPLSARLYRLPRAAWQQNTTGVQSMSFVTEIRIPSSKVGTQSKNKKITSMDIHPSGTRFALLTYESVIEFNIDLSKVDGKPAVSDSFSIVDVPKMPQQESIAYAPDGLSFYYTSEVDGKKVKKAQKKGKEMHHAALMHVKCIDEGRK